MAEQNLVTFDLNDPRAAAAMKTRIDVRHPLPMAAKPVEETILMGQQLTLMATKLGLGAYFGPRLLYVVRQSLQIIGGRPIKLKHLLMEDCLKHAELFSRGFPTAQGKLANLRCLRAGVLEHYGLLEKAITGA